MDAPRPRSPRSPFLLVALAVLAPACASLKFERTSPHGGTFRSSAWALNLFGQDYPNDALLIARGNAADAERPNMVVTHELVVPKLPRFDWILDLLMIRYARIEGTWGNAEDPTR